MAYIKKEQSVALTHPQRDLQITVQGPHNTITQTASAGGAPALNSGDSITIALQRIAEGMADLKRGGASLLQKAEAILEGQDAMSQRQKAMLQGQKAMLQRQKAM